MNLWLKLMGWLCNKLVDILNRRRKNKICKKWYEYEIKLYNKLVDYMCFWKWNENIICC